MAETTRGKLKEAFEGIHRNLAWVTVYCQRSLGLIKDHKPELSKAIRAFGKGIEQLDKLAQDIYSKL